MLEIVPKHIVETDTVMTRIRSAQQRHAIEGITLVGGEPMLQAKGLAVIANQCQAGGLSVMTFTGYTMTELKTECLPGMHQLLAHTDLLVAGPYVAHLRETKRHWVGSKNQCVHFLSRRYSPGIEYDPAFSRGMELRVDNDQHIRMNGWPFPMDMSSVEA